MLRSPLSVPVDGGRELHLKEVLDYIDVLEEENFLNNVIFSLMMFALMQDDAKLAATSVQTQLPRSVQKTRTFWPKRGSLPQAETLLPQRLIECDFCSTTAEQWLFEDDFPE